MYLKMENNNIEVRGLENKLEKIRKGVTKSLKGLKDWVVQWFESVFWWITLKKHENYEVPWISNKAKNIKHPDFPNVKFGNCRLTKWLWTVVYSDSIVSPVNWPQRREAHKETFYSQKKLPGGWLKIPWRHVAADGTVRDWDGYICVAANYIPKWSKIMTTLWPWKVYDTWWMKWKRIDIYTNW